ncbi:hypothetical protein ACKWTF_014468 [Chironomus riparius]
MFPTISKVIKSNIPHSLPTVSTSIFSKIAFVVLNVITGFIAATTFFITSGIQKHFSQLEPTISTDYEYYLQVAIILAFVTVILTIYGCHCADIQSTAAMTAYLVLTSITFVGYLLFITYFLMFKEHIGAVVNEKFGNMKEFERRDVEGWLGCEGDDCKDAVVMTVDVYLQQLVVICCIIVGCQLLCKFIGTKFLSDMQKEQREISISYILNDFESSKQTFMINQKV